MPSCSVFQKSHGMGRVQHKDSTVCTVSVCVCVSLLDRTSYRHTFTPARTHLSALCVTGSNTVSPADSAQQRQPEPTQTDTFVFSVVVVLLPCPVGRIPRWIITVPLFISYVFLHESVGWMTRSAQIPGQFWCLSEASLFYLHLWRSTETSKHQINSFCSEICTDVHDSVTL